VAIVCPQSFLRAKGVPSETAIGLDLVELPALRSKPMAA
jgi:hypothetical protein